MTKKMLVDATHPEETRVAIVESYRGDHYKLEDLDFDLASKRILKSNIYLAKVMRIEPSLQAAFVEYGGNRHGFLPFSEIHPDYFRIPVADRTLDEDFVEGEDGEEKTEEGDEGAGSAEEQEGGEPLDAVSSEDMPKEEAGSSEPSTEAGDDPAETAAPVAEAASRMDTFVKSLGDEDATLGLITDFGNAAVGTPTLTEVAMPETPPESVGGDGAERIVRHHRPRYKIQEVLKRGQIMLIQVVKEERGNKGAALTTFLSLAGRYCVLMPNTDHGGGVSRKITNHQDRRRMKEILDQLEIPEGMAVILRTAGMEQEPPEIQRDLEYLLSMWDNIREQTLQSSAPALIYEEANLIKRSVRDLYTQDIGEILIAGREAYERAHDFMRALIPDEVQKLKLYEDPTPLFIRYQVENQIDALHTPIVQLRSGGYLVINPTEALVSIDVNSGRATRERHIEETAVKTNLEAADEIARQLRLRDLAGLIVIDFIDMEDGRNNAAVERRIKEAMKNDRARLQIGRISPFGLLELSRQRLRPSLVEINFEKCPHCSGLGYIRSSESSALSILRAIEEEALRNKAALITASMPASVAVYILNHKREVLDRLEKRYGIAVVVQNDEQLPPPGYKLERVKGKPTARLTGPAVNADQVIAEAERDMALMPPRAEMEGAEESFAMEGQESGGDEDRSPRRRGRFRQNDRSNRHNRRRPGGDRGPKASGEAPQSELAENEGGEGALPDDIGNSVAGASSESDDHNGSRRRRRGRRGGGRRGGRGGDFAGNNGNGNGNGNGHHAERGSAPYAAAEQPFTGEPEPFIPRSIHEIDTTPKPIQQEAPRSASSRQPVERERSSSSSSAYEVVNPPTDQPKAGWWRRFTGQ